MHSGMQHPGHDPANPNRPPSKRCSMVSAGNEARKGKRHRPNAGAGTGTEAKAGTSTETRTRAAAPNGRQSKERNIVFPLKVEFKWKASDSIGSAAVMVAVIAFGTVSYWFRSIGSDDNDVVIVKPSQGGGQDGFSEEYLGPLEEAKRQFTAVRIAREVTSPLSGWDSNRIVFPSDSATQVSTSKHPRGLGLALNLFAFAGSASMQIPASQGTRRENTYSRGCEDVWAFRNLFSSFPEVTGKQNGVYVDLAAYHPRTLSNTYFLDVCLGWRGICIEADPAKAKRFKASPRPRGCLLVETCVAESDGKTIRFESHPDRGDVTSLAIRNGSEARRGAGYWFSKVHGAPKEVELRCKTLASILKENGVKHVNYMSLDIEGAEPAALAGADFGSTSIDVINMEGSPNEVANGTINSTAKQAADILRRQGFHYMSGTGFRGGRAIDTLWIHTGSPWMQNCTWHDW
eukprot:CAMPEP_0114505388 /NCGR_PEP_ID=MMETSP0109-20121206/10828_1 /TAXON_ID=29199 /ORGANISM="Chlorarachnion reptans, Strain CCCM449" /LENGTH=459 /DNA_ID=CAMNT_0001683827 /DNA_START=1 /DNA_END=1378 /DNA_ORIENTATION=+